MALANKTELANLIKTLQTQIRGRNRVKYSPVAGLRNPTESERDRNVTSVSMPKVLVSMATAVFRKVGHGSCYSSVTVKNRCNAGNRK